MPATVGVISDTHGLLRQEAVSALSGVDLIIHAGDVGAPEVLTVLSKLAPVFAVRGNVDNEPWARSLPLRRTVEVECARIHVVHDLADLVSHKGCHAVISGHSHKAHEEIRDGVLYLNPGSAGPRRFHLPVTLARLTVDGTSFRLCIIPLSE